MYRYLSMGTVRWLKAAAKNHQFSVLNVTDLRAKLQSNDLDFTPACKVFDVCNPHRAKEVLESKLEISTALPCRISVYEEDGKTKVATLLPTQVLGMFGPEGLDSVAQSVEGDHLIKQFVQGWCFSMDLKDWQLSSRGSVALW